MYGLREQIIYVVGGGPRGPSLVISLIMEQTETSHSTSHDQKTVHEQFWLGHIFRFPGFARPTFGWVWEGHVPPPLYVPGNCLISWF